MTIDVLGLVAPKGVGTRSAQSPPPHDAWGHKPPVSMSEDFRRVRDLPRRARELDGTPRAEAIIDAETARFARDRATPCHCRKLDEERHAVEGCITRLRLVQAMALREIRICGGLLGPIGVGHGKTLIDVLAADSFVPHGVKVIALLVPPRLLGQLANDYRYIGQHFVVPRIIFHGHAYHNAQNGEDPDVPVSNSSPVVHVVPYSLLKMPDRSVWLENILKPQAVVADECHKLRDPNTATGARAKRYMEDHPETLFAGWSGSMTAKTPKDYWHLAKWALRGGSPLPHNEEVCDDWCRAIVPSENPADPGPLLEFCAPDERLMDGFRRRLAETLGVVTTTAPAVNVALEITERPAPPMPESVRVALDGVKGDPERIGIRNFVRPDGEELMDALSVSACARQAACGFYYKWIFPHNRIPDDIPLIEEWREACKEYHREVRQKLKEREEHLDSPLLCQHAAERHHGDRAKHRGLPTWASLTWPRWRDVRARVRPETATVWIDDYLVLDVVQWAREAPGIVWYDHAAFGARVAELGGIPMYGGGKNGGGLLDARTGQILERGDRAVALSLKAHGTGVNGLQNRFCRQIIPLLPPNSGLEQVLGRLHRIGQTNPVVRAEFYMHTEELSNHVENALRDALYVEGTLGSQQKLRLGFKL